MTVTSSAEKKTYANRLRSTRACGQFINDHWEKVFSAKTDGVPLVWYDGYTITPMFHAMGVRYSHGEAFSAMLAGRHQELPPQANAENYGWDRELCSYARTHMGCAVWTARGSVPMEFQEQISSKLPVPDFIVNCYPQCNTGWMWDEMSARLFEHRVHKFNVHIPVMWGHGRSDHYRHGPEFEQAKEYLKDQLRKLADWLSAELGQPFDWDRLGEIMDLTKKAAQLRYDAMELCAAKPSPASFFDWNVAIGPVSFVEMTTAVVDCFQTIYDEIKDRVDNGIGEVPNERYRLYWDGIMNWNKIGWLSEKFASYGANVIAGRYTNAGFWPYPDLINPMDPLDGMAANLLCCPSNHSAPLLKELTKELCDFFSIDGVLFHTSRTCRSLTNPQLLINEYVTHRLGLATASFEGDVTDASYYQDELVNKHVEALLESIDARRARQVTVNPHA